MKYLTIKWLLTPAPAGLDISSASTWSLWRPFTVVENYQILNLCWNILSFHRDHPPAWELTLDILNWFIFKILSDFRANHEREMERFLSHQQWKSTMKKEELRKKLRVHMNRHHLMTHVLKALIQKAFIKSDEYRTGLFLVEPFFISSKITALCSLEK